MWRRGRLCFLAEVSFFFVLAHSLARSARFCRGGSCASWLVSSIDHGKVRAWTVSHGGCVTCRPLRCIHVVVYTLRPFIPRRHVVRRGPLVCFPWPPPSRALVLFISALNERAYASCVVLFSGKLSICDEARGTVYRAGRATRGMDGSSCQRRVFTSLLRSSI